MDNNTAYRYFAFISYSSRDTSWGKRLERKLEYYRLPTALCRTHGLNRKPLNPIFFAPNDIQPGGLTEELQSRLRQSRNLIVICSPDSARSQWVGKEIEYFCSLGRADRIFLFIIAGTPGSGDQRTECLNPALRQCGLPEMLGVNIHEKIYRNPWLNRERAYIQLISKLIGVEFDALWQRQRRRLVNRVIAWTAGIDITAALIIAVWFHSQPVTVAVRPCERSVPNDELTKLNEAVITLACEGEKMTDTIRSISDTAIFRHLHHDYLGRKARITLNCREYLPVDTVVDLSRDISVDIHRDPALFGRIRLQLLDAEMNPVADRRARIGYMESVSDRDGVVRFDIPLKDQRRFYAVEIEGVSRPDTIEAPTGENDVLIIEES